MKKIIITVFFLLLFALYASFAFADEVDDGLPPSTPDQVKAGTRQMIRAGIENNDAIKITNAMLQNQFSIEQTVKTQQIIVAAHRKGLPIEPLENKAFEGMTKHIKAAKIVQAMERVEARYTFAYAQAETLAKQKQHMSRLGNKLAAALAAGLDHHDAEKICNRIQQRAHNMNPEQANDLAIEALNTTRDMARLGSAAVVLS